jgi:hypothetical protein
MSRNILPAAARSQRWLWSTLSTFVLAAIVVAVPIALCTAAGPPLGHGAYEQGRKAMTSRQPFDPLLVAHWLERGAVVLAWILWAWMTVCVVLEVRARITGRSSTRLPASRTMQAVAACLVGTALAFAGTGRGAPSPRTPAPVTGSTGTGRVYALRVIDDYPANSHALSPFPELVPVADSPFARHPLGAERWTQATGEAESASRGAASTGAALPATEGSSSVSVEAPDADSVPGVGRAWRSQARGIETKSFSPAHADASDRWPMGGESNGFVPVSANGRGERGRPPGSESSEGPS